MIRGGIYRGSRRQRGGIFRGSRRQRGGGKGRRRRRQRGGLLPMAALVPLIAAGISAAGGMGAAALSRN